MTQWRLLSTTCASLGRKKTIKLPPPGQDCRSVHQHQVNPYYNSAKDDIPGITSPLSAGS